MKNIFTYLFSQQIAIELIEEGSKSVGQNIATIFFPVIPFVLHCLVNINLLAKMETPHIKSNIDMLNSIMHEIPLNGQME